MFSLSFLVITYLHELAQLARSGGKSVTPSVCIVTLTSRPAYKAQNILKEFFGCILQRIEGHCHLNPGFKLATGVSGKRGRVCLISSRVSDAKHPDSLLLVSEVLVSSTARSLLVFGKYFLSD